MTLAEPTDDVLSGAPRGRCDSAERRDGRSPPPVPAGLAAGMFISTDRRLVVAGFVSIDRRLLGAGLVYDPSGPDPSRSVANMEGRGASLDPGSTVRRLEVMGFSQL